MPWTVAWKLVCVAAVALGVASLGNAAERLYWTDGGTNKIHRSNLDGTGEEDLVAAGDSRDITVNLADCRIYWTDQPSHSVRRANLDGSGAEALVTQAGSGLIDPLGIAIDPAAAKMYWADFTTGKIQRANLDGSEVEDLMVGGTGVHPMYLGLDIAGGMLYWTEIYPTFRSRIRRAGIEIPAGETAATRTDIETLRDGGCSDCFFGLALDLTAGKMYWTDNTQDWIIRSNLDGSDVENLVFMGAGTHVPTDIELDLQDAKMYWVDFFSARVRRANLDGTSVENVISGLSAPYGLALELAAPGCGNCDLEPGEQCDDGNTLNGDCCTVTCQFGPGPGMPACCSLGECQVGAACGNVCFESGGVCQQPGGPRTACECVVP